MNELIKSNGGQLLSFLHGKGGNLEIPIPFQREIYLFDTHVAGTSHVEGIEELEPLLIAGDKLDFIREPDNPHDKQAILIRNAYGVKIGYVPKQDNIIFSRLMDAGKLLYGRITSKENKNKWIRIEIKVFLQD